MVRIPAGSFRMGSPPDELYRCSDDDETQHDVTLTRPFLLCRTPVTRAEYLAVAGEDPSHYIDGSRDCPVETVSWYDTVRFCNKLSELDGLEPCYSGDEERGFRWDRAASGYRLPTESEWEYACRAGSPGPRYGPLDKIAWHKENSSGSPHPVGRKAPNAWGLHDMLGNVLEWCWDYEGDYPPGPVEDPVGPDSGEGRILRGGSHGLSNLGFFRASQRLMKEADGRISFGGVRCVRWSS
ncbi:MAG: SUMF1/EgtB/PvdO family nonheme iron enzyme [Pseudomonadota bacterium]